MDNEFDVEHYSVGEDPQFEDFMESKEILSESTIKGYKFSLNKFCRANGKPLIDIMDTFQKEQKSKVDLKTGEVTEFSPKNMNASINKYFKKFIDFCKEKNNKNTSITIGMKYIRSFLNFYDIKLPDLTELEDDSEKWYLLRKEDLNYMMNELPIAYKAITTFLLSTGMREADACELTIGDFMEATKEYHDFVEVEDFIDKASADMIGYWNFDPHKTNRHKIHCKTFNSPESSNYILQNLKRIKNEYLPKKNMEKNLDLKISKKSALFGSRSKYYLGKLNPDSISDNFTRRNVKLRNWNINEIDKKIENGELSKEDRDKEIEKIPKFHPHALRKYFISTVQKHAKLRTSLILEGHSPKIKTDTSYIKITKDDVKEAYLNALPELSLEPVEPRILTNTQSEKLNQKINDLTKESEKKDEIIEDLQNRLAKRDKEFESIKTSNINMQNQMDDLQNQINNIKYTDTNPIISPLKVIDEFDVMVYPLILNYINSCRDKNDDNLSPIEKKIKKLDTKELEKLIEVATEITLNKKIHYTEGGFTEQLIESVLQESIIRMSTDTILKKQYKEKELNNEKMDKFLSILDEKLDEIDLWGKKEDRIKIVKAVAEDGTEKEVAMPRELTERDDITDSILLEFGRVIENIPLENINEEYVSKYIEKILLTDNLK